MEEIRGFTAIDTLYELKGLQIATKFTDTLLPLLSFILIGFGLFRVFHLASRTGKFRDVIVYMVTVVVILYAISPVQVGVAVPANFAAEDFEDVARMFDKPLNNQPTIKVPRILAWGHIGCDTLQRLAIESVDQTFTRDPYLEEKINVRLRLAKILDDTLRDRYDAFVASCYLPVLANRRLAGREVANYWNPFALGEGYGYADFAPYTPLNKNGAVIDRNNKEVSQRSEHPDMCDVVAGALHTALLEHVRTHAVHQETLKNFQQAVQTRKRTVPSAIYLEDLVLRYIVYNETLGLLSPSEMQELARAIPEYQLFNVSTQSTQSNSGGEWTIGNMVKPSFWLEKAKTAISWVIKARQSVDQWIQHHAEGPATYYKVVCYAPYVYGLATMIILALFPFAGFIALLPDHWTSLFTWMKYLLWVKLWMVFWAILAGFNKWRTEMPWIGNDPGNGLGDQSYIFPAIAAMYLVTPALSMIVIQLLTAGAKGIAAGFGIPTSSNAGSFPLPLPNVPSTGDNDPDDPAPAPAPAPRPEESPALGYAGPGPEPAPAGASGAAEAGAAAAL